MKPLKRLERYLLAFFKFGRTEWNAKQALREAARIGAQAQTLHRDMHALSDTLRRLQSAQTEAGADLTLRIARTEAFQAESARAYSDLGRRLDMLLLHPAEMPGIAAAAPKAASELPCGPGFQAFQDTFYNRLENRYRGSREEIKNRLLVYLPDVEAAVIRCGHKPVLDIGCGRGEWLELLRDVDINAIGVDTNAMQIEDARALGLEVRQQDAIAALQATADNSLSVVSAHHLIEHLPFESVAWITREALRVLAPGGLLIFETPNPRNVLVGATSFYNDPTHRNPLAGPVLEVLFDTAGFYPTETRALHPHERLDEFLHKTAWDPELANLLFGPQDLALLGTKPNEVA